MSSSGNSRVRSLRTTRINSTSVASSRYPAWLGLHPGRLVETNRRRFQQSLLYRLSDPHGPDRRPSSDSKVKRGRRRRACLDAGPSSRARLPMVDQYVQIPRRLIDRVPVAEGQAGIAFTFTQHRSLVTWSPRTISAPAAIRQGSRLGCGSSTFAALCAWTVTASLRARPAWRCLFSRWLLLGRCRRRRRGRWPARPGCETGTGWLRATSA